jgi:histidine triad (HIT) family protein
MTARSESDEKYILDLAAEVLAEPDYRWQHSFPTLLGDAGQDGRQKPLPVDGYYPRHRLIVEYWEKQHSAPVSIMDEGMSISGVSRGHQRRLYDRRRSIWAQANGLRFVILDYRGFQSDEQGRLKRDPARDRQCVAQALRAAGVLGEPARTPLGLSRVSEEGAKGCFVCRLARGDPAFAPARILWRDQDTVACLNPFPVVYGHCLVAPAAHYEQVTGNVTLHQYLAQQRIVHAVAEAVRMALKPERMYILSLGGLQDSLHVHWHIVPCPPGLGVDEQELALLDAQGRGLLALSSDEVEVLARNILAKLPPWMRNDAS